MPRVGHPMGFPCPVDRRKRHSTRPVRGPSPGERRTSYFDGGVFRRLIWIDPVSRILSFSRGTRVHSWPGEHYPPSSRAPYWMRSSHRETRPRICPGALPRRVFNNWFYNFKNKARQSKRIFYNTEGKSLH